LCLSQCVFLSQCVCLSVCLCVTLTVSLFMCLSVDSCLQGGGHLTEPGACWVFVEMNELCEFVHQM